MRSIIADLVCSVAEEEVLSRFLKVGANFKTDGSLLTEADLAAQKAFVYKLPQIINAPVLGEEMIEYEQRALWQQHAQTGLWIVDPVDGTNNFLNGIPHFALSVAFIREGKPEYAVTYDPIKKECFSAKAGEGAWLNQERLPIKQHQKTLRQAMLVADNRYVRPGRLLGRLHALRPFGSQRTTGCCTLDWAYIAAGRFDITVSSAQKLWDYAAGALILQEAGGFIATQEGDDFWSGKHTWKRSVIAALQEPLFRDWVRWVRQNQD